MRHKLNELCLEIFLNITKKIKLKLFKNIPKFVKFFLTFFLIIRISVMFMLRQILQ